ncbi:hypothetical protein SeMB42_g07447 [Synchytrium endobioticum]|uniref:Rap-GAP domain-containing protein n=1 Tax=Synchytrium endobioticum TaxID=286115 RepID=A0A507CT23_9FUNG|nr:hypothetical protein SeMB42_g07447 [Synchytrium endobioticum]TPX42322.1 hypothetical protein SeLEV6574_g05652 [Synchytrium endobioticum]
MSFILQRIRSSVGQLNVPTCPICKNNVYPVESITVNHHSFHKGCFKCTTCKRTLGVGNYTLMPNTTSLYCAAHVPVALPRPAGKTKPPSIKTDALSPNDDTSKPLSPSRMGAVVSQKVQAFSALSESPSPFSAVKSPGLAAPTIATSTLKTSREILSKFEPLGEDTAAPMLMNSNPQTIVPNEEIIHQLVSVTTQLARASATTAKLTANTMPRMRTLEQVPPVPPAKIKSAENLLILPPSAPLPVGTATTKSTLKKSSREALHKSASSSSFGSNEEGAEMSSLAKLNNRALRHFSFVESAPVSLTRYETTASASTNANEGRASCTSFIKNAITGSSSRSSPPPTRDSSTKPSTTEINGPGPLPILNTTSSTGCKLVRDQISSLYEEFLVHCKNLISTYESVSSNSTSKGRPVELISTVFIELLSCLDNILTSCSPVIDTVAFNAVLKELTRLETAIGIEMDQIKSNVNFPMGCLNALRAILSKTRQEVEHLLAAYDEMLPKLLIKVVENFNVETRSPSEQLGTYFGYHLEHIDDDADYYRKYFFGQDHKTFVGTIEKVGPVIISVCQPSDIQIFRAIMRSKALSDTRLTIPVSEIPQSAIIRNKGTLKAALSMLHPHIQVGKLKRLQFDGLAKKLIALDELQLVKRYKFGVLFCRGGQTTEEEMYNNEMGSDSFNEFLTILGDRVDLKGFAGFAAGLDSKHEQTGVQTITTKWRQYEVTYHVSTLLPFFKSDKQQIQRKRHIGNDIVALVFIDGDAQFNPATIRSQFLHVFIIVKPELGNDGRRGYRVAISTNCQVPHFGPTLPAEPLFFDLMEFREFLLAKMINGENAAYKAPRFSRPHYRTRQMMIDEILQDFGASPQIPRSDKESHNRTSTSSDMGNAWSSDSHADHTKELASTGGTIGRKKGSVYLLSQFQRRTSNATATAPSSKSMSSGDSGILEGGNGDDQSKSSHEGIVASTALSAPTTAGAIGPLHSPLLHAFLPLSLNSNGGRPPSPPLGGSHSNLAVVSLPTSTPNNNASSYGNIGRSEAEEGI